MGEVAVNLLYCFEKSRLLELNELVGVFVADNGYHTSKYTDGLWMWKQYIEGMVL